MAVAEFIICFILLLTPPLFMAATVYMDQVDESNTIDAEITVTINTARALARVEDYFISYTIDCEEFSESFQKLNFRYSLLLNLLSSIAVMLHVNICFFSFISEFRNTRMLLH
jgi:hypothetical protein